MNTRENYVVDTRIELWTFIFNATFVTVMKFSLTPMQVLEFAGTRRRKHIGPKLSRRQGAGWEVLNQSTCDIDGTGGTSRGIN